MDIAKDPHHIDEQIVDLLKKHEVPILLVLTKDDKIVDRNHRVDRIRRIRKVLEFLQLCWKDFEYIFWFLIGFRLAGKLSARSIHIVH